MRQFILGALFALAFTPIKANEVESHYVMIRDPFNWSSQTCSMEYPFDISGEISWISDNGFIDENLAPDDALDSPIAIIVETSAPIAFIYRDLDEQYLIEFACPSVSIVRDTEGNEIYRRIAVHMRRRLSGILRQFSAYEFLYRGQ